MNRNIELKARLNDLAHARETALRLATEHLGRERQVDTYFQVSQGRLKLREIDPGEAQLVWYDRPNVAAPKASDYLVVPVANPQAVKQLLTQACGVRGVVDKCREIFLFQNVRIHLDDVRTLGVFLEFEAVLPPSQDDSLGFQQLEHLSREFSLTPSDLLDCSYGDMLGIKP